MTEATNTLISTTQNQTQSTINYPLLNLLQDVPEEPRVTIFNPDGTELITTNDAPTFYGILLNIRRQKLSGYKLITEKGHVLEIRPSGKIYNRPPKELPVDVVRKIRKIIYPNPL